MTIKRILYSTLLCTMIFILSACGSYTNYNRDRTTTRRTAYERPVTRSTHRNTHRTHHATQEHVGSVRPPSQPAEHTVPRPRTRHRANTHRQPALHAPQTTQVEPQMPQSNPVIPDLTPVQHAPQDDTINERLTKLQLAPPVLITKPSPKPVQRSATAPSAAPGTHNTQVTQQTPAQHSNNSGISGRELASHKTEFNAKDENRANNITRASSTINGHIVKPGETFSYNQTVGPTIERRGYEESIIYVEGEKKKGFGGGVCQVSTTLSVAADNAGMKIVERHDHSRPVSYAKEGDEAATSYGGIDFKFKNDKPYPVVIKSRVDGGTIHVSIHEGA